MSLIFLPTLPVALQLNYSSINVFETLTDSLCYRLKYFPLSMMNLYNYPTVIPGKHMTVKHPMLECVPNRTQKTMVSRAYLTILSPHLSNDPHTQSVINSTRNMPASTICWSSNNIFSMCTHTLACTHTHTHILLDLPCCGKPTRRVSQNFLPHTINAEIVHTYSGRVVS